MITGVMIYILIHVEINNKTWRMKILVLKKEYKKYTYFLNNIQIQSIFLIDFRFFSLATPKKWIDKKKNGSLVTIVYFASFLFCLNIILNTYPPFFK